MILLGIAGIGIGFVIGYLYCEMIDRIEDMLDD